MRLQLALLWIYWFIAGSSLVWQPYLMAQPYWIYIAGSIAIVILGGPAIVFTTSFARGHLTKELCVALPAVLALSAGSGIIFLTASLSLRSAFCVVFSAAMIGSFVGVLYFEDSQPSDRLRGELMHRRYLEYLRSFLWVAVFFVVGYLAWEIQARVRLSAATNAGALGSIEFGHTIAFAQLVSTVAAGLVLVVYGFQVKLAEIEKNSSEKL